MAIAYKTPGVYVEEIPKFPPSIAPVETAIPIFIGYTEKAVRNGVTLYLQPRRIESIADYEELYGGAPSSAVEVYLDSTDAVVGASVSNRFLMYDSLRMFYSNGGGDCYIVSIGSYSDTVKTDDFMKGITKAEIEDEPTILLYPDAVGLSGTGLHDVQIEALKQCNKLQDRVTVCDTLNSGDFKADVQKLRDSIGINNLKYGMAYGPWINTSLPRTIFRRQLTLKRDNMAGLEIKLDALVKANDTGVLQTLADVQNAEKTVTALAQGESAIAAGDKTLQDHIKKLSDAFDLDNGATLNDLKDTLQPLYDALAKIVDKLAGVMNGLPAIVADPTIPDPKTQTKDFLLKSDVDQRINSSKFKAGVFDVLAAHRKALNPFDPFSLDPAADNELGRAIAFLKYANAAEFNGVTDAEISGKYAAAANDKAKAIIAKNAAMAASVEVIALYRFAQASAAEYEKKFNDALVARFAPYKNIMTKAADALNLLPPSGAVAGVYAAVDRDRGVWKAPANVSLNTVIGPAVKISHEQQENYNVDVNAGKSINIIRAFPGKGTLIWGARTLAGNDNEWRYVSVRRFFNFVEESVKKATEKFVFEPNDANTWVKVQAMIENFLTTLWRQGALQGIKPEHAFYVAVGLGKTMTALDILEGRMIIEIGMAAVRPAEFIILRFSHKMPES